MTPEQWRQLEQAFSALLELSPKERTAYLDRNFGSDSQSELRDCLEGMLEASDLNSQSLAQPSRLAEIVNQIVTNRTSQYSLHETMDHATTNRLMVRCPNCSQHVTIATDDELSSVNCESCGTGFCLVNDASRTGTAPTLTNVNQFELVERLGMGAFGAVWKARDTVLNRTVALKIPRSSQLKPAEAEKFYREAQTVAQLKHPNIVQVFEVGKSEGSLYIASDFIRGVTLADLLTGQRMSQQEAAQLCQSIALALQHAHESGVVHRDLKPANIMIDSDGKPHIMDFGLAKSDKLDVSMTVDGQILGTPAYMPPEQAHGRGRESDGRADIFSLGVILFELLTYERPFRGNAKMTLHQVKNARPALPRSLNATISRDLEVICLKCLEKEPEHRYQQAQDLADELGRYLKGEPISARPIGSITRSIRWMRRNPLTSLVAVLVLLLIIVGAALIYYQRGLHVADAVLSSDVSMTRKFVSDIGPYRSIVNKRLQAIDASEDQRYFRACLGLLETDPSRAAPLVEYTLTARPDDFFLATSVLADNSSSTAEEFWKHATNESLAFSRRLRALCAVGIIEAKGGSERQRDWTLLTKLAAKLEDLAGSRLAERWILARCGTGPCMLNPYFFCEGVRLADREQVAEVLEDLRNDSKRSQFLDALDEMPAMANTPDPVKGIAVAAAWAIRQNPMHVDRWSSFSRSTHGHLVLYLAQMGVDPEGILQSLPAFTDPQLRSVILTSLAEYDLTEYSKQRDRLVKQLLDLYETDPSRAIHGSSEYVLRHWGLQEELEKRKTQATKKAPPAGSSQQWFVNSLGMTFSCLEPGSFMLGSPESEKGRIVRKEPTQREWKIDRRFAIATKQVRITHMKLWALDNGKLKGPMPSSEKPVFVAWYDAAHFCNWLSEREGLEPCYRPARNGKYEQGMTLVDGYLDQTGYRLPTEPEWEFACRAGSATTWPFGDDASLLSHYAWYGQQDNSPVGLLKPNRFGLFDMLGNMWEWTSTRDSGNRPIVGPSTQTISPLSNLHVIVLRGGGYRENEEYLRSAVAFFASPKARSSSFGFRPVRTLK